MNLMFLFFCLLISFSSFFCSNNLDSDSVDNWIPSKKDFKNWIISNKKVYETSEEFEKRFEIFIQNHLFVEKLNLLYGEKTKFMLNKFADLTPSEFKSLILIQNLNKPFKSPKEKFLEPIDLNENDIPESFDWRDSDAVTPVKDQGQVGTCWAHSAVENLEGVYAIKTKKLISLSVEQIVDCDGQSERDDEHADCGVYGGWPFLVFEYVKKIGGIESESDYPYCCGSGDCLPCSAPGYNKTECGPPIPYCKLEDSCQAKLNKSKFVPNLKVKDWKRTSQNETDIALQLMKRGPLSIALNAQLLQFYFSGVFDVPDFLCDPKNLDHAVLLVGFGVKKSHLFGKVPYWVVKNSWGKDWGEDGYFRIVRNKGKCGVNTEVVTALLE